MCSSQLSVGTLFICHVMGNTYKLVSQVRDFQQ